MKKSELFIHLGLQKTGTTWMQLELFDRMPGIVHLHSFNIDSYLPNGKNVISIEWWAGTSYWKNGYSTRFQIVNRLCGMYPDAKIIVGFREKNSWVKSTYSQYVKNGGCLSFSRWKSEMFDDRFLDFDGYLSYLRSCFDDVFVYWFEELKNDKQGFVNRLCGFLDEPVPVYRDKVYNRGFSEGKLSVLCFWNRFFYSKCNPDGKLPGVVGYIGRWCVKNASGSWQ